MITVSVKQHTSGFVLLARWVVGWAAVFRWVYDTISVCNQAN